MPASCFLSKSVVVVGVLESRMDTPKTSEIEKNYFEQIRFRKQTSLPALVFSGAMRLCSIMFFFQWVLEYSFVREYEYSFLSSTTDDLNKMKLQF